MKNQTTHLRTAVATAVIATAGLSSFSAFAASAQRPDASSRAEIQQTYRADRAACTDGSSTQERGACLAEAAAVRKEALAGTLGLQNVAGSGQVEPTEPDLLANALARCDAVPTEVRSDCEQRVTGGDGVIVVGSVAEGGILRELVPAEAPVMVAQADSMPAQAEVGVSAEVIVAEPAEPVMEADPATLPTVAAAAPADSLGAGETLVPVEPAQATGLMSEPVAETMEFGTATGVDPLADMASHPALAPEAAAATATAESTEAVSSEPVSTEPAVAEPVTSSEPVNQPVSEPVADAQPLETLQAGPAHGADPVAYPEWMVQQRFD